MSDKKTKDVLLAFLMSVFSSISAFVVMAFLVLLGVAGTVLILGGVAFVLASPFLGFMYVVERLF